MHTKQWFFPSIVDDDATLLKGFWAMVRKEGVAFIGSYVQLTSELMMFDDSTVN